MIKPSEVSFSLNTNQEKFFLKEKYETNKNLEINFVLLN